MVASGQPVPGSLFFYAPNKIAPIVFAVVFCISTVWHFYQCVKYRSWKITGLLPFLGAIFTAGFVTRELGAYHFDDSNLYIASTILIYMAPPILELAHYHIFGRLLYYIPYCSPIHPGRTLTTFGTLSAIVEVLNGIGVAWTANQSLSKSMRTVAGDLLKASLILQIVVIVLFLWMVTTFHFRCRRVGILPRNISIPIWALYFTSILVLIRCVYRTVEHFSDDNLSSKPPGEWSPLLRYEWWFYVFDAALMLIVLVTWNILHPRKFLPQNYHIYLARDGVSEVVGDGWKDNRNFLVTVIDPFGCMSRYRNQEKPFWELDGIEPSYKMRRV